MRFLYYILLYIVFLPPPQDYLLKLEHLQEALSKSRNVSVHTVSRRYSFCSQDKLDCVYFTNQGGYVTKKKQTKNGYVV